MVEAAQGSPVAYHVGPLAYEHAVLCDCKLKAYRWISWSNRQPGWRYYRCRRERVRYDQIPLVVLLFDWGDTNRFSCRLT